MFLEGFDFKESEAILGTVERDRQMSIESDHTLVQFLKSRSKGSVSLDEMHGAADVWDEVGILSFAEGIYRPHLRDKAIQFCKPYPRPGAFTEAVMNAIEHGSDFGDLGSVHVRLRDGEKGFLFEVTDPGNGFEQSKIKNAAVNYETGRGNGLVQLSRCTAIMTCEKIQTGFRVALLYVIS